MLFVLLWCPKGINQHRRTNINLNKRYIDKDKIHSMVVENSTTLQTNEEKSIPLISQSDIADKLGISRESVIQANMYIFTFN